MSDPPKEEKPSGQFPVHIKIRVRGVEFEIECREEQVGDVVQKILATATQYAEKSSTSLEEKTTSITKAETCRGVVEQLWRDGWFSKPRSLGDIHEEMTRIGYHYDRTAVAHVLLDLVRDGILTRDGKARRYVYVQKRPSSVAE
ncbi:MAG: hypothetical protein RMJ07_04160 [Nitrososphaerota archaeon]|nr:hypothetical protein [Candidatus Bathyarchaeota archaeon]MDW8048858.1 hypothetical protein [Nitrososphaerota archaeon]